MFCNFSTRRSCRALRLSAAGLAYFVVAFVMLVALPLDAANYTWAVSSGDWFTATNWGGTLPTSNDTAYIINDGTANVTSIGPTCRTLFLGSSAGSGTVQMTGGSISVASSEVVGSSGTFTQSGGVNRIADRNGSIYVSGDAANGGRYNLSGGQLSAYNASIGLNGMGTFEQSGGTNGASDFRLGGNSGGNGTYILSGSGQLSANIEKVGYSGSGTFTQTGGTNICTNMVLASGDSSSGTYTLSGSGQLSVVSSENLGISGKATFVQSGGTHSTAQLLLGYYSSSTSTYDLSGNGQLSAASICLGYSGPGTFTQSGGTNTTGSLYLGNNTDGSGAYSLSGSGWLSAGSVYLGYSGTGTFTQSGGTNSITGSLFVGNNAGSSGTYSLSNSGQLLASCEYIGLIPSASASFQQSGGKNTVSLMQIDYGGKYLLTGGSLQVNSGLINQGIFDGGGMPSVFSCNGIMDLSSGTWQNMEAMSLDMGINSLLIVPAGFNLSTGFASYSTLGFTHITGTVLAVPVGRDIVGQGSINDPVICQGTIACESNGFINLNNGLILSGTGNAALGTGSLTVNDTASGITIGPLSMSNHYIGKGGIGIFTQTGGSNTISSGLFLGYGNTDSGTYILSGNGQLSAVSEYIGYGGGATAMFRQTGGNNTAGYVSIGNGGYYLLGGGTLSITAGLSNLGVFDGGGGTAVVNAVSSVVDLSQGTLQNVESMSMNIDANSLLIVSAGFDLNTGFGSFNCLGLTHTLGTTLTIPAGQGFIGSVSISDAVICQGAIMAPSGGTINLIGGLSLSGTGTIQLGNGNLTTNDLQSGSSSGSLAVVNHYVGNGGIGTFTQSGGTNSISLNLYLGKNSSDSGTYTLNGSGYVSATDENVGYSGSGSFVQSGGTNSILNYHNGHLFLGYNSCSSGTYDLSGSGLVSASCEYVGNSGMGTFTQSGGTNGSGMNNQELSLYLGNNVGGSGKYSLSGGQLLAYNEYIGFFGNGIFTQNGGSNIIDSLYLGNNPGSSGTYSLSGNGWMSPYYEYVGFSGAGTFMQNGGTLSIVSQLYLGYNAGSSGTYNLSGSGLVSVGAYEYVGSSGTGTFTQSGGTNTTGSLYLGNNTDGSGAYSLSGSGLISVTNEYVGNFGIGTFTQSGGTNSTSLNLVLGKNDNSSGTYNLNNGLLVLASLSKGSGSATFNFNGGTLLASSGFSTSLPMILGASSDRATFDTAGFNVTLSGSLSGPGSITKVGKGSLTLAATNSFSGNTLISGGTLILGSSLALQQSTLDTSGSGTLSFGSLTAATLGGLTGSRTLSLSNSTSAPVAVQVGGNGVSTNFTGTLIGFGSLIKIGSGSLLLSGSNTYAGIIVVNAGTLQATGTAALPGYAVRGGINIGNNAMLAVNTGGSGWSATNISTLLSNNSRYFASGSIFGIDTSGGSLSYNSKITGSMGLAKLGGNTLLLTGSNTYSGPTIVSAGTLNINADTSLGTAPASPTTNITFSGNSTLQAGAATVSISGNRNLVLNSGIIATMDTQSNALSISGAIEGAGGLTKIGVGTLTLNNINTYNGNTLVSSGTLALGNTCALQQSTLDTSGSGTLSFGSMTAGMLGGLTGFGTLTLSNSASSAVTLIVGNNNYSTAYSGVLNGSGGLTKIGTGGLTLSGSNTYNGATQINQGKLVVNGCLTNSAVSVSSGGTLGGTGTLGSVTVASGGHLAPGNSPGILSLSGDLTLAFGALIDYELDTPTNSDKILIPTGDLILSGQQFSDFHFTPLDGFGQGRYILIDAGSGSISNSLGDNRSGMIGSYSATLAVEGSDLVLNVVPEPSTFALLGTATLGLLGFLWRRRKPA
ncbi:MAG: autotransporter-associated beta strand repeat-containing protein [Planctomycetota bacterium]